MTRIRIGIGVCLGLCFGAALGAGMQNVAVGVAFARSLYSPSEPTHAVADAETSHL